MFLKGQIQIQRHTKILLISHYVNPFTFDENINVRRDFEQLGDQKRRHRTRLEEHKQAGKSPKGGKGKKNKNKKKKSKVGVTQPMIWWYLN